MKNIFIDCGSNIGQGFEHFKSLYGDSYEYHLYEPNPHCFKILQSKYQNLNNVFLNNKAVLTSEKKTNFYFETPTSEGGSIIETHNDKYYNSQKINQIEVDCVDINEIIDSFDGSNIVLKLDVESSEYDILESLIESNLIFKISKIYCEFHTQYMSDTKIKKLYIKREKSIIKFMNDNKFDFVVWI